MLQYKPYFISLSLILAPLIFMYSLFLGFDLKNFTQTYQFSRLILSNLSHFTSFKFEVYKAFVLALMPLITSIYLLSSGNTLTSHGKAKWASVKEIEKLAYSPLKFVKSFFGFILRLPFLPLFLGLSCLVLSIWLCIIIKDCVMGVFKGIKGVYYGIKQTPQTLKNLKNKLSFKRKGT
ncbi:hypothetical protein [Helicobacter cetorum]|uniref:Uncharacterized protein n=1 Tax=Helicobacter cetorum (strain ATCC BAA-540 / CCUG 52418 / MIT 99-5656) TaxID=1163745 RepID=I0EU86_HELCM|nr:hypothetical protein [Helicobacter cetorum]AFI06505.1 hypothetical protein HCD_07590 [Helicobacter cetorum MIT 99-5656]